MDFKPPQISTTEYIDVDDLGINRYKDSNLDSLTDLFPDNDPEKNDGLSGGTEMQYTEFNNANFGLDTRVPRTTAQFIEPPNQK
jgi:hypothetical protein